MWFNTGLVFLAAFFTTSAFGATLVPEEAAALNKIFREWKISGTQQKWNVSGELCSGTAIDSSEWTISDYNPLIKCDCSYDQNTTCHITHLKVYAVDVVGTIPEELWNLTYLTHLHLDQNYLTGSLSSSIGNLTRMKHLSFGTNALSGKIPEEIGLLSNLILLGMGSNNFSGSLPSSLGNCLELQEIYFDSSGVSGEIPSTFAKLVNMHTVWGSDTELTGNIPDFIGNWSKLITLRLQGNSFEGSIPSTFSRLTSLIELRISDLSNGSSSLAFLKDSKSLTTLVLRNNKISGSIPSNIGEYNKLKELDLSFNELSGEIPDVLFNISSLSYLFLGNNNLTGTLPTQKSSTLLNIDLSYNGLSGRFPTWINQQHLTLNLVANTFTFDSATKRVFPELHCLQRNFPCNRGRARYSNFAVKCGGQQLTKSGIVFESDSVSLGPTSYYVNDDDRWAVSNVGVFTGRNNNFVSQNTTSLSNVANTLDSELFQTARISAGSLRYYGLGLENGIYTLNLQFSEYTILSSTTWTSPGRRVFDIYIQGTLEFKNFDIQKEAGGKSFTAVEKKFKTVVSENYIEVHLFWAGKGTCCIPAPGTYGPSISAISAEPDFIPTVSNSNPSSKKNNTGLIVGLVLGISGFLLLIAAYFFIQRRKGRRTIEDEELQGIDAYTYSYAELRTATNDFSLSNKLGEGGFGPVFQGMLNDGILVAVKQLSIASHQGKSQFLTEIAIISAVQHRNLVKLYGCCIEGSQRLLVYEYLENKSLDQALFKTGSQKLDLNWPTRYEICLGVARGLAYLHEESRLRIVHRDVKASNILLDADLVPKISDFGLAKLYDDKKTHISTRVAGTFGYLAPEYAMRGHLTEKADVFSFGVVALELVSGRQNSDASLEEDKMYLLEWAWHLHENNWEMELVDPSVTNFTEEEVKRVIRIALLCTQTSPTLRPTMSRVVGMLSGDVEVSTIISKPDYLTDWKFNDLSTFMSDASDKGIDTSQYNSTASTSQVMDGSSPYNASKPMLNDTDE